MQNPLLEKLSPNVNRWLAILTLFFLVLLLNFSSEFTSAKIQLTVTAQLLCKLFSFEVWCVTLVWAVSQTSSVLIKLAWQLLKLPWHVLNPHLAPYEVRWGSSKILLGRIQANLPCHYKMLITVSWDQKKKKAEKNYGWAKRWPVMGCISMQEQ